MKGAADAAKKVRIPPGAAGGFVAAVAGIAGITYAGMNSIYSGMYESPTFLLPVFLMRFFPSMRRA